MNIPSLETIHEAALQVFSRGVMGGELNPEDPIAQVLVAGANLILEATAAGLTPEDVFVLIQDNARTGESEDGGSDGYL